jgi:hypothetical protein
MTNPLTKRFTPVVAAVQAGIMKVELDEAQRQAALKLPRKQALRELHKVLQAKLDAALLHTITHQLGHEPKEEEVSKGQLEVEPCHEPGFDHGEIYFVHGHRDPVRRADRAGWPGRGNARAPRPANPQRCTAHRLDADRRRHRLAKYCPYPAMRVRSGLPHPATAPRVLRGQGLK